MASGGSISSNFIKKTCTTCFSRFLQSLCLAPGGSISSNFVKTQLKMILLRLVSSLCVAPGASGRPRAISCKKKQTMILKIFTKSVCVAPGGSISSHFVQKHCQPHFCFTFFLPSLYSGPKRFDLEQIRSTTN